MTQKITVHDPRGFAPKVTGKRLAPRCRVSTARCSTSSIACSTTPRRS